MKKVKAMHVKLIVRILGEGFSIMANIDGRENIKHNSAHIMVNTGLDIHDWYFNSISDMHQKLGTFNWYSPLCTGNIAYSTVLKF